MHEEDKILILHLSDFHFCEGTEIKSFEFVLSALRGLCTHCSTFFVVVTGDVAFSGGKNEYYFADEFFTNLLLGIEKEFSCTAHFIAAPGNHDCDFSSGEDIRTMVSKSIIEDFDSAIKPDPLAIMLKPQTNFRQWRAGLCDEKAKCFDDDFIELWKFDIARNKQVVFRCCNTAWMSSKKEKQGQLKFPIKKIAEKEIDSDLIVSVFHHPYNWLESNNGRAFRRKTEETSDIILSGHEHDGETFSKCSGVEKTEYLEGCVFHDHNKKEISGFHVILLDINQRKSQIHTFAWNGERYSNHNNNDLWNDFIRKRNLTRNRFEPHSEFEVFLRDTGIQLTHPRKSLFLDDIFIVPDLAVLVEAENGKGLDEQIVKSEDVFDFVFRKKIIRFTGPAQSGKTALAKQIFRQAGLRGLVPLFIDGSEVSSSSENSLKKNLRAVFRINYSKDEDHWEEFLQLGKEKKVLIIDRFAQSNLNPAAKVRVAKWFSQLGDYVFILGDDLGELEGFILGQSSIERDNIFTFCKIKSLGYLLRHELIKKWLHIGQEETINESETAHKVRDAENFINTFLGKDVVPSYPIFLLIILQQLETRADLNTNLGSYGHFFDVLIKGDIQKQKGQIAADTKINYLAVLAWALSKKKFGDITMEEWDTLHQQYCILYQIRLGNKEILSDFKAAKILKESAGKICWFYRYQHFYFVAYYMANHLEDGDVQAYLDELARDIHLEDNANTLIFLTYHSKDRKVVEKLIQRADEILNDFKPCNLESDIKFINALKFENLSIRLVEGDQMKRRHEKLKRLDEFERSEHNNGSDFDEENSEMTEKERKQMNDFLSINIAFKSMQVLGQIARNYAGSMTGFEKKKLAETCIGVGYRTLGMVFKHLEHALDNVVFQLEKLLQNKLENKKEEERKIIIQKSLFMLSEIIGLGIVKRISHSIGSETLIPVFDNLCRDSNEVSKVSYEFVNISIRLDHTSKIPENEIHLLKKKIGNNIFCNTMLNLLVREYFYLFPVDHRVRQRICDTLGIKLIKGRVFDMSTKKLPPK